jgi:BlaI family transcriptional regulator, penicillinase repressor
MASKDMHFKMRKTAPGARMPTNAELEILEVLWSRGSATVRDVHEHLKRGDEVGYTTVLKLLQNMLEKGLVLRQDEQRSHIYTAACKRQDVVQRLTRGFIDRVFSGSRSQLVLHALREERLSDEEIAEIQRALDRIKQQDR